MKKGINNILKPLYDLWHKVMDKFSVENDILLIDGKEVIVKLVVSNIKSLSDSQCEMLQCGDVVAKKTDNQFHCYKVTYKEDKHGLVLSYMDASLIEGQSYDYTDGHWVYNSEDKTEFASLGHTDAEVKALSVDAIEEATSGTIAEIIGLDSSGNMIKGSAPSGGGKLYKHYLVSKTEPNDKCIIISSVSGQSNLSDTNVISVLNITKVSVTRCCFTDFAVLSSGLYVGFMNFTQSGTTYIISIGSHLSLSDSTKWDDTVTEL